MAKRRPSGDGMVRKRPDGRWEGRIVVGHKDDSRPIFRSVFGKTQKELLEKLHQQKTIYKDVELTEGSRMTLTEWMDKWLAEYMEGTVRPSTLKGYKNYIDNHIKPHLGDKIVSSITQNDVQRLYTKLKKSGRIQCHPEHGHTLSDSVIRSIHTTFHHAMKTAQQVGIVALNPTEGAVVPKGKNQVMQILNRHQMEDFLAAIQQNFYWHDFFYTAITTGLRRGELCGLQWDDLNLEEGSLKVSRTIYENLTVGDTKTGESNRKIFLPQSTVELLTNRKQLVNSPWIFPNPVDPAQPTRPTAAYRQLKLILEKENLPNIRFHDLRHSCATIMLYLGYSMKDIQTWLGHSNYNFTADTYVHSAPEAHVEMAGAFSEKICGLMPSLR